MKNEIIIKRADKNERDACYRIRHEVFVHEQQVPEEVDIDAYDAEALHFIVIDGTQPIATARVVLKDEGKTGKIGRVAVVKWARRKGIGKILMQFIEHEPALRDVTSFILEAQTHALFFYQKLGYQPYGEEFIDAGLPHLHMKKVVAR